MKISGSIQNLAHLSPEHWFPGQLWFPPVPMDLRLQGHCHQRHTIVLNQLSGEKIKEHLVTAHHPHQELDPFQFGLSHQTGLNLEVREKH